VTKLQVCRSTNRVRTVNVQFYLSQQCTQFLLRHILLRPAKCLSEMKPGTKRPRMRWYAPLSGPSHNDRLVRSSSGIMVSLGKNLWFVVEGCVWSQNRPRRNGEQNGIACFLFSIIPPVLYTSISLICYRRHVILIAENLSKQAPRKPKELGELPVIQFVHQECHFYLPGLNPRLRCEKR
jgi:hypothetical protein